jgi:manganese transport protein
MPLETIGVALQHAPGDSIILSAALTLARKHESRLTLIHAVDAPDVMVLGWEAGSRHASEDKAYLEELAREIEDRDLPVETLLKFGRPANELIRAAEEAGLDLLVRGSHGHRGLEDLVRGQTIASVRHRTNVPVLVVQSGSSEPALRSSTALGNLVTNAG